MSNLTFEALDFDKYHRWLNRMVGTSCALAACNSKGLPAWTGDKKYELNQTLNEIHSAGCAWQPQGQNMQREDVDDKRSLLYTPVIGAHEKPIGWLAVLAERASDTDIPIEWDLIAESLEDIVHAMQDECRVQGELDGMAQELSERYEELHLFYNMDEQIRRHDLSEEVYEALLRHCAEHLDVDVVAFVSPIGGLTLAVDNLSKPIYNLDLTLVEMRGDLFRFVHSTKKPVVVNNKDDARRTYIFTDMPYKILACPVFTREGVTSALVLLNHEHKRDFSNSDRKLAEALANQLSSLSRMKEMLDDTKKLLLEQSKFTEQMAAALIEAVEAKDPYTRGHSERVHYISMEIGKALRLTKADLKDLYWGSLLHDVGKIGIPDAVLCKPSRLTADEYDFIKVHPERSYEILRHIDALKGAVAGARHHQEKFDGTGYPHELKGEDIPLHARIIALADTYDSITSSRPYRAGRSHEAAMKEIQRVSGTQLDPELIVVLEKICETDQTWIAQFNIRREVVNG